MREKNNRLQLEAETPSSPWLMGDPGKLHQILINLIGNANKFTDNGSITLRLDTCPGNSEGRLGLQFSVLDTGIGISPDKQEEVFQAFTQVDTSTARRYSGIGLGLAICERLVSAMGGKISLDSDLGQGTTIGFQIELEVAPEAVTVQSQLLPLPRIATSIDVLMVEDDATNSMVTSSYLQRLGHEVVVAQSGEQALKLIDEGGMSLVLLDISLPGIDGLTILKYIRTHDDPAIAALPVIAMSAHVFTEEVDQYINAGMNGFLGKPFSMEDLERAIEQALSGDRVVIAGSEDSRGQKAVQIIDGSIIDDDISRLGLDNVDRLAELFFQSATGLKAELCDAMERQDFERTEKLAHKLGGSVSNFGLQSLRALSVKIETGASHREAIDNALRQQLDAEFEKAVQALTNYLSAHDKRIDESPSVIESRARAGR